VLSLPFLFFSFPPPLFPPRADKVDHQALFFAAASPEPALRDRCRCFRSQSSFSSDVLEDLEAYNATLSLPSPFPWNPISLPLGTTKQLLSALTRVSERFTTRRQAHFPPLSLWILSCPRRSREGGQGVEHLADAFLTLPSSFSPPPPAQRDTSFPRARSRTCGGPLFPFFLSLPSEHAITHRERRVVNGTGRLQSPSSSLFFCDEVGDDGPFEERGKTNQNRLVTPVPFFSFFLVCPFTNAYL